MKLALFQPPTTDKPYVGDELTEKYCENYVRLSEWVDIEFPPLSAEARQAQLARVDAARESCRKYYETQIARLNTQAESLQS